MTKWVNLSTHLMLRSCENGFPHGPQNGLVRFLGLQRYRLADEPDEHLKNKTVRFLFPGAKKRG